MRPFRGILALLTLAVVLASCTGTTENIPPLLLAVGRVDSNTGQPQMVLVEDNFSSSQTVPRDLSVVAGSARNLPYPAVASDVVDRADTRTEMVVLVRQLTATTSPESLLLTFNLQNIDPTSPTAFTQDSTLQLTGGTNPVFVNTASDPAPWCFSGVTVSLTGRYVTLLDDPAACGDTSGRFPRLFQVDTQTRSITPITVTAGVQDTQATVPLDDQADTDETLYFTRPSTTSTQIYSDAVPHDSTTVQSIGSLSTQNQIALQESGGNLVTVTNLDPTTVNSSASKLQSINVTSPHTVSNVDTVDGARAFAVDPAGITSQVVVAGSSRLAVHSAPNDSKPEETAVGYTFTGVAAAIDPVNQFGYVVDDNQIVVLDLLTVGTQTNWYARFSPDLTLPVSNATGLEITTVAWTRAAP